MRRSVGKERCREVLGERGVEQCWKARCGEVLGKGGVEQCLRRVVSSS